MHSKHRNGPGNMYRSNSMGVGGVAAATRISPESAMRGHRMYGTEHRNYNRDGYGRLGRSKHFQSMPPPQEVDVFMEAGRLAAEYLVSKGVLPPNALSGKWQNDAVKNQEGSFQEFRQQVERTQSPANGRGSVHSRLGNAVPEAGPGRRRYSDEYNSLDWKSSSRERKRTGSLKNYGMEVNKEFGRTESWTEKCRASPDQDADGDDFVGHNGEQPVDDDSRVQSSSRSEATEEVVSEVHTEPSLEQCSSVENADANNSSLSNEKPLMPDAEGEQIKRSDDSNKLNDVAKVVEEGINDNDFQQKEEKSKEVMSSSREDILVCFGHTDLVKRCRFLNVPTRTRSSLMNKVSKDDLDPVTEDMNMSKKELSEGSDAHAMDNDVGSSAGNASPHENHEVKQLKSDILNAPPLAKELGIAQRVSPRQCLMSRSLTEVSQCEGQETDEQLPELQSSNSMFMERGEKRPIDYDADAKDDLKRFRQWFPPLDAESDASLHGSSSMEEQPSTQDSKTIHSAHVTLSPDEKILDNSLFPRSHAGSIELMEEKQLFPGSFKTCDLNLVGTNDVNENRDIDPVFVFPSVTRGGKVGSPIGIDLSMSNNITHKKDNNHSVEGNDIEVIDLDSDSAPEHKNFNNPERSGDTVFADLDGFPNNVHNPNAIQDVQDGYGLMISELLANGSPTCSSVPADLNSLNNHMVLPNTEGILGDDDSIYMSLGEIPISLLGPWEQPTRDYGKPF